MSDKPEETDAFLDLIEQASAQFDQLCQERHEAGQQEYGQFTFLENDVTRMMMEELADTANYCRMQFIKLMLLQTQLEAELLEKFGSEDEDVKVNLGAQAFKGVGKVGWRQ